MPRRHRRARQGADDNRSEPGLDGDQVRDTSVKDAEPLTIGAGLSLMLLEGAMNLEDVLVSVRVPEANNLPMGVKAAVGGKNGMRSKGSLAPRRDLTV
jgi:hypothetical protein